jgi:hypothetical protein
METACSDGDRGDGIMKFGTVQLGEPKSGRIRNEESHPLRRHASLPFGNLRFAFSV